MYATTHPKAISLQSVRQKSGEIRQTTIPTAYDLAQRVESRAKECLCRAETLSDRYLREQHQTLRTRIGSLAELSSRNATSLQEHRAGTAGADKGPSNTRHLAILFGVVLIGSLFQNIFGELGDLRKHSRFSLVELLLSILIESLSLTQQALAYKTSQNQGAIASLQPVGAEIADATAIADFFSCIISFPPVPCHGDWSFFLTSWEILPEDIRSQMDFTYWLSLLLAKCAPSTEENKAYQALISPTHQLYSPTQKHHIEEVGGELASLKRRESLSYRVTKEEWNQQGIAEQSALLADLLGRSVDTLYRLSKPNNSSLAPVILQVGEMGSLASTPSSARKTSFPPTTYSPLEEGKIDANLQSLTNRKVQQLAEELRQGTQVALMRETRTIAKAKMRSVRWLRKFSIGTGVWTIAAWTTSLVFACIVMGVGQRTDSLDTPLEKLRFWTKITALLSQVPNTILWTKCLNKLEENVEVVARRTGGWRRSVRIEQLIERISSLSQANPELTAETGEIIQRIIYAINGLPANMRSLFPERNEDLMCQLCRQLPERHPLRTLAGPGAYTLSTSLQTGRPALPSVMDVVQGRISSDEGESSTTEPEPEFADVI